MWNIVRALVLMVFNCIPLAFTFFFVIEWTGNWSDGMVLMTLPIWWIAIIAVDVFFIYAAQELLKEE